jgi:hypothetical protein
MPPREDRSCGKGDRRGNVVRLDDAALAIRDVTVERERDGWHRERHGCDRDAKLIHARSVLE